MKKKLLVIIGLVLAACSAGAAAYLVSTNSRNNELNIGAVTTEIVEQFTPPSDIRPGEVIPKNVRIKNTGENDCYVRVQVLFSDEDMKGLCSVDYNTSDWVLHDGWYYYRNILGADETTRPLFTAVTISQTADEGSLSDFDIFIRQESRQSHGQNTYASAWSLT